MIGWLKRWRERRRWEREEADAEMARLQRIAERRRQDDEASHILLLVESDRTTLS